MILFVQHKDQQQLQLEQVWARVRVQIHSWLCQRFRKWAEEQQERLQVEVQVQVQVRLRSRQYQRFRMRAVVRERALVRPLELHSLQMEQRAHRIQLPWR